MEFYRGILKQFRLADLEDCADARVKVLVVKGQRRTLKVMQAIARGICIVDESVSLAFFFLSLELCSSHEAFFLSC